jgi:predicted SAM-dependent methyltransferase
MDRRTELLRFIDRDQVGIEIGPWHTPLAPKRDGYRSLSIDVFDTDTLRRRAVEDPHIDAAAVPRIEDVDLVGPAQDVAELVAARFGPDFACDYVLSSHNLEHIPDPIRFLQGCERILRRNGVVSLAIPDHRCCFDHFRTPSSTADWLSAHFERRTRPTLAQWFHQNATHCRLRRDGKMLGSFDLTVDPRDIVPLETLREAYAEWKRAVEADDTTYRDTHCWAFTPESCALILHDLRYLGLLALDVADVSATHGNEFYVHLRKPERPATIDDRAFYDARARYLRAGRPGSDRAPRRRWIPW